jgi:hypothetical protein
MTTSSTRPHAPLPRRYFHPKDLLVWATLATLMIFAPYHSRVSLTGSYWTLGVPFSDIALKHGYISSEEPAASWHYMGMQLGRLALNAGAALLYLVVLRFLSALIKILRGRGTEPARPAFAWLFVPAALPLSAYYVVALWFVLRHGG